jgi:hypothetical protein
MIIREVFLMELPNIMQIEVDGIIFINQAFAPPENDVKPLPPPE